MLAITTLLRLFTIAAANLRAAFIALVGFSLNLYVLILFDGQRGGAREAGVKYYYLSTFSSGLIVFAAYLFLFHVHTLGFLERALVLLH